MTIVFLDEATVTLNDIAFDGLKALGAYTGYPNSNEEEIIARAAAAEAVIANKTPLTARVIAALPRLKLITVIATGYNNVDLAAAAARGVAVCNVAGYAVTTVPQHTFALILNLATQAYRYHADIAAGAWQRSPAFTLLTYPTWELAGKNIGIVGYGAIGRGVARIAQGFGMEVLAYDTAPIKDPAVRVVELDALLRQADVVTVHCPLTDRTRNLIDAAALAKMKPTAILINTARGGIVDEQALAQVLNAGRIAGAGVDVLTREPPREGNVLLGAKNVILTPHSAWSTVEARQRLVDETAANIKAFMAGRPRNIVN
jgi:glycerate dehydrogenase